MKYARPFGPEDNGHAILQNLLRGRERIMQGWTRKVVAKLPDGASCEADDVRAVAWCALGAIEENHEVGPAGDYLDAVAEYLGFSSIIAYNDHPGRTQDEMIYVYNIAIGLASL